LVAPSQSSHQLPVFKALSRSLGTSVSISYHVKLRSNSKTPTVSQNLRHLQSSRNSAIFLQNLTSDLNFTVYNTLFECISPPLPLTSIPTINLRDPRLPLQRTPSSHPQPPSPPITAHSPAYSPKPSQSLIPKPRPTCPSWKLLTSPIAAAV
jgi:hypothetical protein